MERAAGRPNLHIVYNAFVTKINVQNNFGTLHATSVNFDLATSLGNVPLTIRAKKDIIVSAGTVHSSKLLLLSGIGPREVLQEVGVPLVLDTPVGKNLMDHVIVSVYFSYDYGTAAEFSYVDFGLQVAEYFTSRTGDLASLSIIDTMAFVNVDNSSLLYPNVQVFFLRISLPPPSLNFFHFSVSIY